MTALPRHNPVLRLLYVCLVLVMVVFFVWLFTDPEALYHVGPAAFQASDFESCRQAGGEVHGSRCYMSESVFFER